MSEPVTHGPAAGPRADAARPATIRAVGLVHRDERGLLLVRAENQRAYYLPGGKIDPGETEVEALRREVREELGVELREPRSFARYVTDAVGQGEGVQVDLACYTAELEGAPAPAAEIADLRYCTRADYLADPEIQAPAIVELYRDLES
ncbi:NUDIX hydrolase [Saccharopolyspora griseoalba]|uniref:NUDIX domain-containing protein n=1 Tax=Saccharopolyspora griseoalba TaxID=1431848 RepID=A0ABW2LNE4_9PSEU